MKKRITIQEKFELIMECRNSGLSDYQWCKQRGLSPSTFYGYVKQVRKHNCEIPEPANLITCAPDDKPDIVKLEVVNDDSQPAYINQNDNKVSVPTMEITLGKISIKVTNDVNPVLLSSVVSTLGDMLC